MNEDCAVCPLCGHGAFRELLKKSGRQLVHCRSCGLVRQFPMFPEAVRLACWQGETRLPSGRTFVEHYQQGEVWRRELANLRLDQLRERHFDGGKLLDVGCATGIFIDEARKRGFQVQGIDISSTLAGYGRHHYGLDIREEDAAAASLEKGSFDVVTVFDVFSTMRSPLAALQNIHSLLKPGGLIWLTACYANLGLWLFKEERPFNLYLTPRTMNAFLTRAGFSRGLARVVVKNANLPSLPGIRRLLYRIPVLNSLARKMVEALAWKGEGD
ncbi:MAG: methyltransferase domain-containing protein [Deltaproteobacteria bacterium]|nr:methyltransferase domain-containing protein [Deltaproteobacteria bacterium]